MFDGCRSELRCPTSTAATADLAARDRPVGIVGRVWVRVTELSVLQRNGGLKRVAHGTGEALVLLEAGGLVALNNECPHHGAPFTAGYRRNGWIECPLHAWRFDLATGQGISHPGSCLTTYPTRVTDGVVEVEFPD